MRKIIVLMLLVLSHTAWAFEDCYVGAGIGRSHVGMSGTGQIERLSSDLLQFTAKEDRTSTTKELYVGCLVYDGFGRLNLELGALRGILYEIDAEVSVTIPDVNIGLNSKAVVEAGGYSLSALWEKQATERGYFTLSAGAMYAKATADISLDEFDFSIHGSKSGTVALIGVGWRQEVSERCSIRVRYNLVGHHKVSQTVLSLQCLVTD